MLTLVFSVLHGAAHIARFVYENNPKDLYGSTLNRSGLVALLVLLPTAVPMSSTALKEKVGYTNQPVDYYVGVFPHPRFPPPTFFPK